MLTVIVAGGMDTFVVIRNVPDNMLEQVREYLKQFHGKEIVGVAEMKTWNGSRFTLAEFLASDIRMASSQLEGWQATAAKQLAREHRGSVQSAQESIDSWCRIFTNRLKAAKDLALVLEQQSV